MRRFQIGTQTLCLGELNTCTVRTHVSFNKWGVHVRYMYKLQAMLPSTFVILIRRLRYVQNTYKVRVDLCNHVDYV